MKILQLWIGESIPDHVMDCFNQLAKFHQEGDKFILATDRERPDFPDQYLQMVLTPEVLLDGLLTLDGWLKFNKANVATKADLIRFALMSKEHFLGYTYMDADVLMVRDPREVLEPYANEIILYKSNDRADFSCNGIITNPENNTDFMAEVVNRCFAIFNDPEKRKVEIKDLMFAMDEYRKEIAHMTVLRGRVSFLKLGYAQFCDRFSKGHLLQKDFDAVTQDPQVKGIHLWRPESMPRDKAYLLDEWSKQFLSQEYVNEL